MKPAEEPPFDPANPRAFERSYQLLELLALVEKGSRPASDLLVYLRERTARFRNALKRPIRSDSRWVAEVESRLQHVLEKVAHGSLSDIPRARELMLDNLETGRRTVRNRLKNPFYWSFAGGCHGWSANYEQASGLGGSSPPWSVPVDAMYVLSTMVLWPDNQPLRSFVDFNRQQAQCLFFDCPYQLTLKYGQRQMSVTAEWDPSPGLISAQLVNLKQEIGSEFAIDEWFALMVELHDLEPGLTITADWKSQGTMRYPLQSKTAEQTGHGWVCFDWNQAGCVGPGQVLISLQGNLIKKLGFLIVKGDPELNKPVPRQEVWDLG